MKVSIEKIVTAYMAVKNFNEKVPSNLAFRLSRFQDKTTSVVKTYETANLELFKKYGEQIEGKPEGTMQLKKENFEAYNKEIAEILKQEEEIDYTVNLSLFEGIDVSKDFFVQMGEFITE